MWGSSVYKRECIRKRNQCHTNNTYVSGLSHKQVGKANVHIHVSEGAQARVLIQCTHKRGFLSNVHTSKGSYPMYTQARVLIQCTHKRGFLSNVHTSEGSNPMYTQARVNPIHINGRGLVA